MVIHSREDDSASFSHAEWSREHIAKVESCEAGFTGQFFWIDPDTPGIRPEVSRISLGERFVKGGSSWLHLCRWEYGDPIAHEKVQDLP
jgi:hypothetical protein